jgi:putative MATE family efflux protein
MRKFGNREFFKETLRLGLPVAIQGLLTSSLSFIDTLMVGSQGENALAAVGAAGQFGGLLFGFYWGLCCGGTLFIAQYHGIHDEDGIRRAYGLTNTCMMALAVIFSVLAIFIPDKVMQIYVSDPDVCAIGATYLRALGVAYLFQTFSTALSTVLSSTERVKLPLVASIASILTNTGLNWFLIYGHMGAPKLGVMGAAVSSVVASIVNAAVLLIVCIKQKNIAVTHIDRMFHWSGDFVREYFIKSSPLVINETLYSLATLVVNIVYGRQGAGNLAAISIFRTVEGLAFSFFRGLSNASSVMVGKRVGAGELGEAKLYSRWSTMLCPMLSFSICACVVLVRGPLLSLFDVSDAVRMTATQILIAYMFLGPVRHTNYLQVNLFRSGGETRMGMFMEVGGIWLITVPMVLLTGMAIHAPFIIVFISSMVEELVKFPIELKYMLSLKWIKPVTEQGMAAKAAMLEAMEEIKG